MLNLPTSLTLARIFMVPFLVVVLLAPPSRLADTPFFGTASPALREILGVAIFLVAILTDFLDGFLARRRDQVTTLGTLLDPIADKLLTSAAFISLVEMGLAPAWMVVIIVGREFVVSGLRSVMATQGVALPASSLGKLKTTVQAVAIVLLILTRSLDRWGRWGYLGVWALWISMIIALISAVDYLVKFVRTVELGAVRPDAKGRAG
ncbi:MAG: CDP-diacylglycerol--glycerol-3-phosphate 3-phosphatidyltransferase [Acidobacteriota bacterium]